LTLALNNNEARPYDLHVLGTPPAFILSQDQTLQKIPEGTFRQSSADKKNTNTFELKGFNS